MSIAEEIETAWRRRIRDERRRTAWHEAGHAVVAYALGGAEAINAAVTIDPGMTWNGLACVGAGRIAAGEPSPEDVDVTDSPLAWPQRERRLVESELAIYLAGEIAEELREREPDAEPGEPEPAPPPLPAETQPSWERLPTSERESLEEAAVEEIKSDRESTRELAFVFVGNDPERVGALLRYIAVETSVLLRRRGRQLDAVAEALRANGALSADEVIAVLQANDPTGGTTP